MTKKKKERKDCCYWTGDNSLPSQNTNIYHMIVKCSQMFANIKRSITVFNEHLFDVCEDSSKCEKRLCMTVEYSAAG